MKSVEQVEQKFLKKKFEEKSNEIASISNENIQTKV